MHPKYVIIRLAMPWATVEEMPFLIPAGVPHDTLKRLGGEPVAAGFYDIAPTAVHVWGHSESLGLPSRGQQDADLITQWFAPRLVKPEAGG